jgi:serine/threonine protein kinase
MHLILLLCLARLQHCSQLLLQMITSICSAKLAFWQFMADGVDCCQFHMSCCDALFCWLICSSTGQTGTPTYMAPEVFLALPYTEKVDVFSFGVALYELMTRSLLVFTQLPPGADEEALNR